MISFLTLHQKSHNTSAVSDSDDAQIIFFPVVHVSKLLQSMQNYVSTFWEFWPDLTWPDLTSRQATLKLSKFFSACASSQTFDKFLLVFLFNFLAKHSKTVKVIVLVKKLSVFFQIKKKKKFKMRNLGYIAVLH